MDSLSAQERELRHMRAVENEGSIPWHANFGSTHYGLHMYLGTGFSSGQPFNNQTAGAPIGSSTFPIGVGMQLSAGPFSKLLFFSRIRQATTSSWWSRKLRVSTFTSAGAFPS